MKLPVSWLREFVEVKVEPRRLGEDLTMAGFALEGLETDGKDAVLDIDVTTNRVDAMNVYGVAREVSVIYGLPLRPLELSFTETGAPASSALRRDDRGRRPLPALLRRGCSTCAWARRRRGSATAWSRWASGRSATWST